MGIEATSPAELDRAVTELSDNREAFTRLGVRERITLLDQMARDTHAVAEAQVRAACRAKRIPLESPTAAEEWLGGPMTTLRNIRLLRSSLEEIDRHGAPQLKASDISQRPDGQVTVRVLPRDTWDKMLFGGFEAEIWMDPSLDRAELEDSMAVAYRGRPADPKTALVLGAGNVASIGPMDVLYKMFVENQVCVLKMNPVNEYLGPFVEQGFKAAIDAGYLRVTYGEAEVGEHLVQHELVDEIHITGSDHVHDIIVWGADPAERQRRKDAREPRMTKRITSELGCVTPVIVVPGRWSKAELDFQAQNVATMMANNGSFNCNAAKVLVTSANWPQRGAFLAKLRDVLNQIAPRAAYYPGAEKRFEEFTAVYPQTERIGATSSGTLPWGLATGIAPGDDQMAFTREAWCSFLAETPLDASDASDFLNKAVAFCNDRLWGTLSCTLVIDPRTAADAGVSHALDNAIAGLRYGSVVINHFAGLAYGNCLTTWGAYPEHSLEDIGSGIGVVHNVLMFERPQKSVVRGPFVVRPKPPWFATHKRAQHVGRRLTEFEYQPSALKLPGVIVNALRG